MIQQKKFYRREENLTPAEKSQMWNSIKKKLSNDGYFGFIHWRSYSLGVVTVIILFFTIAGIISLFNQIISEKQPEILKVNKTYQAAIKDFEKLLPENFKAADYEINLDEEMSSKIEKLSTINEAIDEMNSYINSKDHSRVKQKRLMDLYQIKLNVIEEIIELEENEE